MSPEAREHSFDELAKGLATGTLSRGKAIRWMGGALLGWTWMLQAATEELISWQDLHWNYWVVDPNNSCIWDWDTS